MAAKTTRSRKRAATTSHKRRLPLLRKFRTQVAKLAKPGVVRRIASDIKKITRRRARVESLVAAGKLTRRAAKSELALLAKMRFGLARSLAAAKVVPKRALAAIDREIKAVQRGEA
jgi:hypothetical protein